MHAEVDWHAKGPNANYTLGLHLRQYNKKIGQHLIIQNNIKLRKLILYHFILLNKKNIKVSMSRYTL